MQWLELLETSGGSVEARLQACTDAVAFMQPFLQAGTHASDRSVAAQHGRPVMRLLKAVSALLSSSASNTQLDEAYAQVAVSALNSLEAMRSALNTKGLELARQRYALVRKLMSREQFHHALAQASKLHAQLGPYERSGAPGYDKETVDLQLAAAISILVCAAGLLSSGRQGDGASHAPEAMLRVHASLPVLHGFIQQQLSMPAERADADTKQLLLVCTYAPQCAVLVSMRLDGTESGDNRAPLGLLRAGVLAAGLTKQGRRLTQVLLKLMAEQGAEGAAALIAGLSELMQGGDDDVAKAAAACTEELVQESCCRQELALLLAQGMQQFLGKQQPAGNGVPPAARSTHLVALYLAALATSSCTLAQLSVDAHSVIVSAVDTAGLSCGATQSSPGNVSHQPSEAAEQWWQERQEAALVSWSRAVVEQEDWLCGDAAVDRVALTLSQGMARAMTYCAGATAKGLPAPLALTAGVVAIKVLSTAACRQNAAAGSQASSLTACLQQLLVLASRLVEATAVNADGGIGPDELQWMSVCCANAGIALLQHSLQAVAPKALKLAVDFSLCKLRLLTKQGEEVPAADIKLLVDKRFKPHVTALSRCSQHGEAAQAAAEYVALTLQLVRDNTPVLAPLIKLHVRSRLNVPGSITAAQAVAREPTAAPAPAAVAATATHGSSRNGRKPSARSGDASKQAVKASAPHETEASVPVPAEEVQGSNALPFLTISLLQAAAGSGASASAVLCHLDLCACEELACIEEECRQRCAQDNALEDAWLRYPAQAAAAITGALAESTHVRNQPAAFAQALLLRHITTNLCVAPGDAGDNSTARLLQAIDDACTVGKAHSSIRRKAAEPAEVQQRLLLLDASALSASLHAAHLLGAAMRECSSNRPSPAAAVQPPRADGSSGDDSVDSDGDVVMASADDVAAVVARQAQEDGCPVGLPSDGSCAAPALAASSAWAQYQAAAHIAAQRWQKLVAARKDSEGTLPVLRHAELCLQLFTQAHSVAALQGDVEVQDAMESALACIVASAGGSASSSSSLRSAWAVMAQNVSCLEWAVAAHPGPSLALMMEAETPGGPEGKLAQLCGVFDHLRRSWQHQSALQQAQAATTFISQVHHSSPLAVSGSGGLASVLATAQLHHVAAASWLRAGDTLQAYGHAQEALRLSSALHSKVQAGAAASTEARSGQAKSGTTNSRAAGTTHAAAAQGSSDSGGSGSLLLLPALGQYLASLLQCAAVFEALGCAEDASSLLKECRLLALSSGASQLAALAALRQFHLQRRRSPAEGLSVGGAKRPGHPADPSSKAQLEQALADVRSSSEQPGCAAARCYLEAQASFAQAAQYLDQGCSTQALTCATEGITAVRRLLQEGQQASDASTGIEGTAGGWLHVAWGWELRSMLAELLLTAAQASSAAPASAGAPHASAAAAAHMSEAEQLLLSTAGTTSASGSDVGNDTDDQASGANRPWGQAQEDCEWRVQLAQLRLLQGLMALQSTLHGKSALCCAAAHNALPAAAKGEACGRLESSRQSAVVLGLPGVACSTPSLPLEQAFAASLSLAEEAAGSGLAPEGREEPAAAPGKGTGRKTRGKTAASSGRSKVSQLDDNLAAHVPAAGSAPVTFATGVLDEDAVHKGTAALLQALELSWRSCPRLASQAAAALIKPAAQAGCLYAALLCLHLSNGCSLLHQHLMHHSPGSAASAGTTASVAATTAGPLERASSAEKAAAVKPTSGLHGSQLGRELLEECQGILQAVVGDMRSTDRGSSSSSGSGSSGCNVRKALCRFDREAQGWFKRRLAWLPPGAAVCSITTCPCACGRLLLTRLEKDSVPLLVMLPDAAVCSAGSGRSSSSEGTADSSSAAGHRPSRDQHSSASSSGRGSGRCSGRGEMPEARWAGAEGRGAAAQLLSRLQSIMQRSAASMEGAAGATQAQKTEWWKSRVALDQDMQQLLFDIGHFWLGPWRVPLLPRMLTSQDSDAPAVVAAAAKSFVQDHLSGADSNSKGSRQSVSQGCAVGGCREGQLMELVSLLLPTATSLSSKELEDAMAALLPEFAGAPGGSTVAAGSIADRAAGTAEALRCLCAQLGLGAVSGSKSQSLVQPEGPGTSRVAASLLPGAAISSEVVRDAVCLPNAVCSGLAAATTAASSSSCAVSDNVAAPTGRKRTSRLAALGSTSASHPAQPVATIAEAPAAGRAVRGRALVKAGVNKPQPQEPAQVMGSQAVGAEPGDAGSKVAGGAGAGAIRRAQLASASAVPAKAQDQAEGQDAPAVSSAPILLVLGPELHAVPWESAHGLSQVEFYRSPSLLLSCLAAGLHMGTAQKQGQPAGQGLGAGATQVEPAAGVAPKARRGKAGSRAAQPAAQSSSAGVSRPSDGARASDARVDLSTTFYVLNPAGDLPDTQQYFEAWFSQQLQWQGLSSTKPAARQLLEALHTRDMFVYCGHGSGEQYLPLPLMRRLQSCACSLLVGCSSGRLRLAGEYHPAGAVVSYLLSGCPAVVANLWDVTDRDIDRFCEALLSRWLGPKGQAPVRPQGAGTRLSAALSGSRQACKLPHLIGAAPVCYGIPTELTWKLAT